MGVCFRHPWSAVLVLRRLERGAMGYFRSVPALQLRLDKRSMDTLARPILAKVASVGSRRRLVGWNCAKPETWPDTRRADEGIGKSSGDLTRTRDSSQFHDCRCAEADRTRSPMPTALTPGAAIGSTRRAAPSRPCLRS